MKKEITSSLILAAILLSGMGLFFWKAGFFEKQIENCYQEDFSKRADINQDGKISIEDLSIFLSELEKYSNER